jgi:hypothetical protein
MENDVKAQEVDIERLGQAPGTLEATTNMAEMQGIMDTAFDFG